MSPSKILSVLASVVLVAAAATAQAGLVAQYEFDEGSGLTAADAIGSADVTIQNNAAPGWTAGKIGPGALSFDGSDWAEAVGSPLNGTDTFSVTWWMKTTQGDKDAGIISSDDGGGARLMIWRNGGAVYANGGVAGLETTNFLNDDQWHQYTLSKENGVAWRVYRDGVEVDSSASNVGFVQGNGPLRFARHANAAEGARWPGTLDDVGLWDEVVAPERIALIHGLGRYSGVDQADTGIDNVLAAFAAGPGSSAVAGHHSWRYASAAELGNPAGVVGTTGGQNGVDTFLVLDTSGNGVQFNNPALSATIGAGVSIPLEGIDTAGAPRTNVDLGYTAVLSPGKYAAVEFTFAYGQDGTVIPFLAELVGDHEYRVLALGDEVAVTGTGTMTVDFGGDAVFDIDDPTRIYAGITNPPGADNPVYLDNGTATLTDHDGSPTLITSVGQLVGNFSNPNLGRTYAFEISLRLVPEPSTLGLAVPALGGLLLWGTRRRRGGGRAMNKRTLRPRLS